MVTGAWPTEIDHINRIRHDNRWENLREVTRRENRWNTVASNISGVKNVHFHNRDQLWVVKMERQGKVTSRYFKDFAAAVAAARKLPNRSFMTEDEV